MTANYLLLVGVASALVFVAVLGVEGARRPGYDPTYHTGSVLSLGDRGWVQRANFLQMGVGMVAFTIGVYWTLDTPAGAGLLAVFGFGMVVSGVFRPDPLRGYPPESQTGAQDEVSRHHQVHHFIGGAVAFFALFGACLVLAGRFDGVWRLYTLLTAAFGLLLTIGTALAYERDDENTGLVQRAVILVYWSWIVLVGLQLGIAA